MNSFLTGFADELTKLSHPLVTVPATMVGAGLGAGAGAVTGAITGVGVGGILDAIHDARLARRPLLKRMFSLDMPQAGISGIPTINELKGFFHGQGAGGLLGAGLGGYGVYRLAKRLMRKDTDSPK